MVMIPYSKPRCSTSGRESSPKTISESNDRRCWLCCWGVGEFVMIPDPVYGKSLHENQTDVK